MLDTDLILDEIRSAIAKEVRLAVEAANTEWLGVEEASAFLGVSKSLMAQWRMKGQGPQIHKMGGRVLYRRSDLNDYVAQYRVAPHT